MAEIINDFYVTLPSNASIQYFPRNTQSSYRTKLIQPLFLSGQWEVGLSEIFIPRNWFNIGEHNNDYIVYTEVEKSVIIDNIVHDIAFNYLSNEKATNFFLKINASIRNYVNEENSVMFIPEIDEKNVTVDITKGFELHISKEHAPKLLYMLYLPDEDIVITESQTFKFRSSTETREETINIINKNPINSIKHIIPFTLISESDKKHDAKIAISNISKNIQLLELQDYITFTYTPVTAELEIRVSEYAELHIKENEAQSFLSILNENKSVIVTGIMKFRVNPLLSVYEGEKLELIIKEYPKVTRREKETKHLSVNVGMYKTAESLFREFEYIRLKQLPNLKVFLEVPKTCEVHLGKALAEMLGFENQKFKSGKYRSKYPLELDAGISEIFVYSDLIESHHVGDSYAPLLRVIPCMNEKNEQIVKHYETPIYFPLKSNFVDTIEIELKTSSGKDIIFTGGKTLILLSFRRRESIN